MKDKIRGSVRFIFQPAEECGGGAKYMIRDGCMEVSEPQLWLVVPTRHLLTFFVVVFAHTQGVDEIYGIHVWSPDTLGAVGLDEGWFQRCSVTSSSRCSHVR